MLRRSTAILLFSLILIPAALYGAEPVRIWEDTLVVPTYPAAPPERAPLFYEGRTYQGAKGPIYPYPIIDKLIDTREDRPYKAVYLENEYVRLCVLPELGGRIFEAIDKTNGYNFFYRQHVIKPALIGMIGAWISGGVEWNIPHHHRASSFLPVQYRMEENADGSKTVWVGEMELRHRMRWIMGLTLRPGKSYVEATLKLFNNTPVTNSFLYFANVAVHTNENYQVIFPPSVDWATQHSKVQFSSWPFSKQDYGGVDFTKGVDVSWYKNHPSPTSMFAFEAQEDFLAGYDHGKHAGTLHIADHGVMPGKKFFTWGNGGDGRAWDNLLTDTDGAYLELMVGGYSDNQPDYSWIQPYEVKTVKEFWYPFRDTEGVKNANVDAAVNLEVHGAKALVAANTTSAYPDARVLLIAGGKTILDRTAAISPSQPFSTAVAIPSGIAPTDLRVSVSAGGKELVSYQPVAKSETPMPAAVTPPARPDKIGTAEELLLAGQRLEQFYSPAREPDAYYEEALKRDPSDYRANTALGLLYYRRGLFEQAEQRFKVAVARVTKNYTRPRDGEALYYLGLAQRAQGNKSAAADSLYRASWSYAWHTASYYALAELQSETGTYAKALESVEAAISTSDRNTKALNLRSALLRHLARPKEAAATAERAASIDPLDHWSRRELRLARNTAREASNVGASANDDLQPYLEMAVNYGNAGLWDDAVATLSDVLASYRDPAKASPLVRYYLGFYAAKTGQTDVAAEAYRLAPSMPADFCFPFRLEEIAILREAIARNPRDVRAPYYLGNLLYDIQPAEAIRQWERSRELDPSFPMASRNLALAYARREKDVKKAIPVLEAAVAQDQNPRFIAELDQMYEAAGFTPAKRLAFFERHQPAVHERDDVLARQIVLLNQAGQYDRALELLSSRKFHIWEGAFENAHDSWVNAHLLKGHALMKDGKPAEALKHYRAALEYPENLGVGKPYRGDRSAAILYYVGEAEAALGNKDAARTAWESALAEVRRGRVRVTTESAELDFHRALAMRKLGDESRAQAVFQQLIATGENMVRRGPEVDQFAKFGERVSRNISDARGHYIAGLGYTGIGNSTKARSEFDQALKLDVNQMWAKYQLTRTANP